MRQAGHDAVRPLQVFALLSSLPVTNMAVPHHALTGACTCPTPAAAWLGAGGKQTQMCAPAAPLHAAILQPLSCFASAMQVPLLVNLQKSPLCLQSWAGGQLCKKGSGPPHIHHHAAGAGQGQSAGLG